MMRITGVNGEADMNLKDLDLNLLIVFNQLLVERRVSRVAETLEVSQPAVSNALARLRKKLGDPLFLSTPRGMQPTPFAEALAEPLAYALGMIHSAVNQRSSFVPEASERAFKIAMTDIGEIYFLPKLLQALEQVAPRISITTVRNTAINLGDEMEAGLVDLAVGYLPMLKAGFFQRRLFHHQYVCAFRKGHALDKRRISLAEFSAADHVVVIAAGTGHGAADEAMERAGVTRNVKLTVPHFVAVGHILHETNLVATVPERFVERIVEPFDLTYVQHPAKLPEIAINLFWHAKFHKDPANQWLRESMFRLYAGQGSTK